MTDFKTCLGSEKNSEIIGRMFIAHYSKINEISDSINKKCYMDRSKY